ncbi:dynamin family protein [Nocardia ninae]|uniref:Isoniazid-inducible protein iniA n=1 Tax=Nocardia ninae NBRC 108245 TaxID=1210091 RepID=A0A511MMM9_9NOCA|nr:dynamin family protein [Nocardia ninae]GEM41874.1 isoniazid-inducible protein iniA [Nocardia ninae NBRC 108245]
MSAAAGLKAATVKHPDAMAPLIRILDELREMTRFAGRDDLGSRLSMVRARVSDPRVRLVVVGEPKNGMSTLVNSLVGASVSATNSDLSVPVIVEYGPEPTATLVRSVDGRTERQSVDPLDPGPAISGFGVIRAEFTQPSPLLADGVVVMDAPGARGADNTTWSMIAAADAVLYVGDAATELTVDQIAYLQRIQQICPTVICVLNKIDQFSHWSHTQQRNRELLDAAGLGFAVAPVSAELHRQAGLSGNYQRDIESGVPQLIDHLRDYVVARADSVALDAAVQDIRLVSDHLALTLRNEVESLRDPRMRAEITDKLVRARDEAEQLRQRTANWQVTLVDGSTELMADIEHDLRHRLRSLVRDAEAEIMQTDPARRWKEFGTDLDARICEAVEENFVMAHYRSVELSEQVASKFLADNRAAPLPNMRLENPGEVLEPVQPLEPLESAKARVGQQILSALRGSYGGILMVGLVTSILKMSLVNWYSIGAGVLLGINALWDERKNLKQRRRAEAKLAVARLMDDVIFQVSKESRNRLRAMQRVLRDHFTDIAAEVAKQADEALRLAEAAYQKYGDHSGDRIADVDGQLGKLRGLREQADSLTV